MRFHFFIKKPNAWDIKGSRYDVGGNRQLNNDPYLYHKLNRLAIDALTISDTHPTFSRAMFNMPPLSYDAGCYKNQIISFGASIKELEDQWAAWLTKFEGLLRHMYWEKAVVYLDSERYGERQYEYENKNSDPFTSNPQNSMDNWSYSGDDIMEFFNEK